MAIPSELAVYQGWPGVYAIRGRLDVDLSAPKGAEAWRLLEGGVIG